MLAKKVEYMFQANQKPTNLKKDYVKNESEKKEKVLDNNEIESNKSKASEKQHPDDEKKVTDINVAKNSTAES